MDTGIPLFFSEIEYLLLETIPLDQASNLDLFSATQPNEFAETLSFLLELRVS